MAMQNFDPDQLAASKTSGSRYPLFSKKSGILKRLWAQHVYYVKCGI